MLHVGIDEAGYGPLLGPLVTATAAFRLLEVPPKGRADLAGRLRGLVVRRPRDARRARTRRLPVPVDDSKRIHQRFGVEGLARGVGAFAAAMDTPPPADLHDLLQRFSDRQPDEFGRSPWYVDLGAAAVPSYPWTGPLGDRFLQRGVQALDLRVLPLTAGEFNTDVRRTGNKARVLGLAAGAGLLSLLDRFPNEDAHVVFDRQGARLDYAAYLADLFPFASVDRRPAPPDQSRYDVALPNRRLDVLFATRADGSSLAVSWASMAAKLTRELFMTCLNRWFGERHPELRPTAGYTTDGRRFLEDVADVIREERVPLDDLVRVR